MHYIHEGPVKFDVKEVKYGSGKSEPLPVYIYNYPGGAKERLEDYGDYFGVSWSTDGASPVVMVRRLGLVEGIGAEINGFQFMINAETVPMEKWSVEQAAYYVATCKNLESWSYDCGAGTYYWDKGSGREACAGVLTYNGAPTKPISCWQYVTAAPEIVARAEVMRHVPDEEALGIDND